MPTTKSTDHGSQHHVPVTSSTQPQQPPSKQNRRGWLFHRGGGGGGTTKKGAITAGTPNHASASAVDHTPKTNNLRSTSSTDTTAGTSSAAAMSSIVHTTNHYNSNSSGGVPGILKKETKDYDAIIASKRYQEQIKNASWFCRTKYFQKMCHMAFDAIDSDESGQVDEKELYAGLLLIHLQLGMYAGPAACRPLSREQVHTVFVKMDTDHSGTLNVLEFQSIMSVLFSNVLLRVIVQWSMTLMIVPWLAQFILSGIVTVITSITNVITNLDEHSAFFNFIELTIEGIAQFIYVTILPNFVKVTLSMIQRSIRLVPISIWKALPLTILSTVLGIVVVPYCIFQIDHYFQSLADRHHQHQMERNQQKLQAANGGSSVESSLIYKSKSL
jgi:EF-hand domain pair